MTRTYDAIVVGARCAGSPTAMLLARKGYRVLLVDRASFPSDTLSTHYIHQPGGASLARWGLLGEVVASNCPPVPSQVLDFGDFSLRGAPPPCDGVADAHCVRRTVLDQILVSAAAEAGADVRERFVLEELLETDGRVTGIRGRSTAGGRSFAEQARIVVGADGMNSIVARLVKAAQYEAHPSMTAAYYSYWSGVPVNGAEIYPRPGGSVIAAPTNDGLTMVIAYWPASEFGRVRSDIGGCFDKALETAPSLAERVHAGTRVDRFRGTAALPNFYRRAFGEGWALVGDAGHHKDPILALGISDAFRDAELLAEAIHSGLSGRAELGPSLAGYEHERDRRSAQGYQNTLQFAALQPPPDEMQQLLRALAGNQEQIDRFHGMVIGSVPASEFFAPENIEKIMGPREPSPTR